MGRKRSVLHSEQGHRHRNYKRRMRNLLIEITFIVILTFVAIKFTKKDEQIPTVSGLSQEEQQQIIEDEIHQEVPKEEVQKQIILPSQDEESIIIVKAVLNYQRKNNQTIINFDVKNQGDAIDEYRLLIGLLNNENKTIKTTYLNIQYLEKNQQVRINIVLDGDFSETEEIKLLNEE